MDIAHSHVSKRRSHSQVHYDSHGHCRVLVQEYKSGHHEAPSCHKESIVDHYGRLVRSHPLEELYKELVAFDVAPTKLYLISLLESIYPQLLVPADEACDLVVVRGHDSNEFPHVLHQGRVILLVKVFLILVNLGVHNSNLKVRFRRDSIVAIHRLVWAFIKTINLVMFFLVENGSCKNGPLEECVVKLNGCELPRIVSVVATSIHLCEHLLF